MTRKRIFLIDEQAAVNIIKCHYHGNWNALTKIFEEEGTLSDLENFDDATDESIKKLSDKKIESILSNIEY